MKLGTIGLAHLLDSQGALPVPVATLELLFDTLPDTAFFIKDREGRYLAVNHSLVERAGREKKSQLIGRRVAEVYPGRLGQLHGAQDAELLRTGRPLLNHLELHWHRPHRPCWCLTTKLALKNTAGEITGLIGISRDLRDAAAGEGIPEAVADVLDAFARDCAEPVTPSHLAARAGLSGPRFARLIRRIFGVTPSQFITRTRIEKGARLLVETAASVAEVALDCGFCDHSAFTRAFRSTTGLAPSEYRQQRRQAGGSEGAN